MNADVVAAWGRNGKTELLAPGVTRVADLVFREVWAPGEWIEWEHRVLAAAADDAIRFQRIVPATDGRLVVDGWVARTYMSGLHRRDAWDAILAATDAVSASLALVPAAIAEAVLPARRDVWAIADRMAWGDEPIPPDLRDPVVAELLELRQPAETRPQIVHGDMTGNVLFADGLPPAVIDFSPYRRPPAYARGVVVADAIVWHRAPLIIIESALSMPDGAQGIVRAMLFRHLTALLLGGRLPMADAADRYAVLRTAVGRAVGRRA